MSLVNIIKDKCNLSYSCVRECPVNAIEVKINKDYARVIPERCIGCGSCINACPQKAIVYSDSKKEVEKILEAEEKKVAIVAPSISGEFDDITDYRKFVQMIKSLGFDHVNEVSFGADLIALKYKELFNNFKGKYYISANCPAVVNFIEKFHPELVNNLATLVSPMVATAKVVGKKYGKDIKVVYIGPCVDSKEEAKRYKTDGKIDGILTFVELRNLFEEYKVHESKLEYSDFDPPIGYKGSLFPISNGLLQAAGISEDLQKGKVITAEGKYNMLNGTQQFENDIVQIKRHFNMFYCEGCLMGPGTSPGGKKYLRRTIVTEYANKRLKNFDFNEWEKEIEQYIGLDFSR